MDATAAVEYQARQIDRGVHELQEMTVASGRDSTEPGPASRIRTRVYRAGVCVRRDFPVADISEYLDDPVSVVWLDLCRPTPDDFAMVDAEFGLHELAVEDALQQSQRPKLDHYPSHLFLSAYAVVPPSGGSGLMVGEIAAFITGQALITVRHDDLCDMDAVATRWDEAADLAQHGVAFLIHGLLDHLVDGHLAALQRLDDGIEQLDDLIFDERRTQLQSVQRRSFRLRKDLVVLRRVVLPMREVLSAFLRRDVRVVGEPMRPYFHDVYDHVLRAAGWTESLRELIATTVETNLTVQANRTNLIMKKVTSWAAVIAVPTAVTGFYGQNLPYPGSGTPWGVVVSSALIAVMSLGLYITFRRKDWM